jgi:hypothetical protein
MFYAVPLSLPRVTHPVRHIFLGLMTLIIFSKEQNYEAPCYAVFSILMLLPFSLSPYIILSLWFSNTLDKIGSECVLYSFNLISLLVFMHSRCIDLSAVVEACQGQSKSCGEFWSSHGGGLPGCNVVCAYKPWKWRQCVSAKCLYLFTSP